MVSIIVPVYNTGPVAIKCLNSLLASEVPACELIVVDDGSTIDSFESFDKDLFTYIKMEKNFGQAYARNVGAQFSRGDILIFVDSDVVVEKDTIKKCIEELQDPSTDAVNAIISAEGPHKANTIGQYKNFYMEYFITKSTSGKKYIDFVHGAFFAIKKEAFSPWPVFREYGEDTLYGKKLADQGKKIKFSSKVKIFHLKNYNIASLMKNAFFISRGWTIISKPLNFAKNSKSRQSFFHAGLEQVASILIWYLMAITIFFSPMWVVIEFLVLCLLNSLFYLFILKKAGRKLFFISFICLNIEYLAMSVGIISGTLSSISWTIEND
jgi:GT2 family glycosyltransferase